MSSPSASGASTAQRFPKRMVQREARREYLERHASTPTTTLDAVPTPPMPNETATSIVGAKRARELFPAAPAKKQKLDEQRDTELARFMDQLSADQAIHDAKMQARQMKLELLEFGTAALKAAHAQEIARLDAALAVAKEQYAQRRAIRAAAETARARELEAHEEQTKLDTKNVARAANETQGFGLADGVVNTVVGLQTALSPITTEFSASSYDWVVDAVALGADDDDAPYLATADAFFDGIDF